MRYVADSSAVLAVLNKEPGGPIAQEKFGESAISAVNLAEVVTKLVERGVRPQFIEQWVESTPMKIVPYDAAQAIATGKLRQATRSHGLSLGDRACLALAAQEGLTALTTDRVWADIDGIAPIELIR